MTDYIHFITRSFHFSSYPFLLPAVALSKAAILGIALGALVILLMILIAACRPYHPTPFPDGSLDKPGTLFDNCCAATCSILDA